jgi:hypothetical protein
MVKYCYRLKIKNLVIKVEVLWVVTLCSIVVGYKWFGGPCCFHLQGEVNGTGKKGIDIGLVVQEGSRM